LMMAGLKRNVDPILLDQFQIIPSRVKELDGRPAVLWLHDLYNDPESAHLQDELSRSLRFAKLIFVSYWQMQSFQMAYNIRPSECLVLQNAVDPIEFVEKDKDQVNLIYHTTPHRGLEILVPVFEKLTETFSNIHLDVYSSFNAYGWGERDKPYEELFERCKSHPQITYHGFQPNDVIRTALQKAHIFAYPSIWQETSCISAIEAMSAGCEVVCSSLAALPETTAGFASMYPYHEDPNTHANIFVNVLGQAISRVNSENVLNKMQFQKNYIDVLYNWESRGQQWTDLLKVLSSNS